MNCAKIMFAFYIFAIFLQVSICWSNTVNGIFNSKKLSATNVELTPDLMDSIAEGVQMAMDECKTVFQWDRWNCPQSSFSKKAKIGSTKEKAYTNAIATAGIIYAITKNCSRGELQGCGCNAELNRFSLHASKGSDWTWGGCSDDTGFGETVLAGLDNSESAEGDVQAFVERHNNKIGNDVVRHSMRKSCKCHGLSGSCSLRTCWMQMAPFAEVALALRDRYSRAIMIGFEEVNGNSARPARPAAAALPDSLLFVEPSPNYCHAHNATGAPGTRGRSCSRAHPDRAGLAEKRSCRNLCRACGYKVKRQQRQVSYRCNCKFNWCCEVTCGNCIEKVDDYSCA